jgi:prepilin-type N-terminal cleavage/methylation domain-containing protein
MRRLRGFTLIELAIVMVILTILAGGLLMPLARRIETQQIETTKATLDEARDALIGFAMSHPAADGRPHLPCPDTTNDGQEDRTPSGCTAPAGNLPWITLGLASQDAWGNRITYAVTAGLADSAIGIDPSAGPVGDNDLCASANCPAGTEVASNVPVILLSHGKNGLGALSIHGTTLPSPVSPDEIENDDGDTEFVSRTIGGEGATEFDDLVTWIPSSILFARVCPSGCP